MKIQVSVIIPCHNVERYVQGCLTSVLQQTYSDIEILCVDDGSQDNTFPILKDFSERCENIIAVKTAHGGAPRARNKGLKESKGRYVQFLDADDRLRENKIEHQVNLIKSEDSLVDVVVGAYRRVNAKGENQLVTPLKKNPWLALCEGRMGYTCSNLWSRDILEKVGGWSETDKSSQEAELMFQALKYGVNILYDDHALTIKNDRSEGSISSTNKGENFKRLIELRKRILTHLRNTKALDRSTELKIQEHIFNYIRSLFLHDSDAAEVYHDELIEKERFRLKNSDIVSTKYLVLYKFLGFRNVEKFLSWVRK